MEDRRHRAVRQGERLDHEDLQGGHWMTAAVDPNPEAVRPELTDDGGRAGSPPGGQRGLGRAFGTTGLRVGTATLWLSVIVLLPLAAILWQAAGGGWSSSGQR